MKYIILGSGIAGMAAAEAIRETEPGAEILMISSEKELCFNRPMLIGEFALDGSGAALFEQQQTWPAQHGVEVRLGVQVTAIDREKKEVLLAMPTGGLAVPDSAGGNAGSRPGRVSYDKLIYALGAEVTIPPIPGADGDRVFVVRTREDMQKIRAAMTDARHAVVIGGGMLGLEDAWALREEKLDVAIVEQKQRVAFGQIDQSAGNLMKKRIERMGVPVYVNATVTEIGDGYVSFTQPASIPQEADVELVTIPADLVILSTGVTPNSALGEAAGLAVTSRTVTGFTATGCAVTGRGMPADAPSATTDTPSAVGGTVIPPCGAACGQGCPVSEAQGCSATEAQGCPVRREPRWIAVDEHCQTSDPDIYAAGDCAAVNGRNDAIWDEAREMGRVAGTNAAAGAATAEEVVQSYHPVIAEHVFTGFDTEVFTVADSSGAGTDGVYIRHADVEIFDYQRERYIRVSLQDGIIAGILLINASELAPELMDAYKRGAGEEEARQIILRWKENHEVDFKPAAPFTHRGARQK